MASVPDYADRFQISRVFSRAFAVMGRNLPLYIGLSLLLVGLPSLLLNLLLPGLARPGIHLSAAIVPPAGSPSPFAGHWGTVLVGFLILLICRYLLQATLVRATIEDLGGRRPGFGECLATGFNVLLPIIGIAIVMGIGVMIGIVLLIVPGIILALAWSVAIPVEVEERGGVFASLSRSWALTSGSRWPIFGLLLITGVVVGIIQIVILMVFAAFGTAVLSVASSLMTAIFAAVFVTIGAAMYVELRTVKEGATIDTLAAVFA